MCIGHTKKPSRNDEPGIYGQGDNSWRAPTLGPGDILIYDECGRCSPLVNGKGSTDYHHIHFRVVKTAYGPARLLVKHGGGQEDIEIGYDHTRIVELLAPMDSDSRFLMLHALYNANKNAARNAREEEAHKWRAAAADKRIKTRRYPKRGHTKVWIEDGPRIYDVEAR